MINVNFIGRLGADAEIRTSKANRQYVALRVATDEYRNGERTTSWVNVTYVGDRALKVAPFLKKGSQVFVMGTETVSTYRTRTDEIGISRDVMADRIEFVGSGNTNASHESSTTDTGTFQQPQQPIAEPSTHTNVVDPQAISQIQVPQMPSFSAPQAIEDEDDDLPF